MHPHHHPPRRRNSFLRRLSRRFPRRQIGLRSNKSNTKRPPTRSDSSSWATSTKDVTTSSSPSSLVFSLNDGEKTSFGQQHVVEHRPSMADRGSGSFRVQRRSLTIEPKYLTDQAARSRGDGFTLNKLRFSGLYGREKELSLLRTAYDTVQTNNKVNKTCSSGTAVDDEEHRLSTECSPELLLVYGDPGVGKTALVTQLEAPVRRSGGLFCMGKFDQQRRKVEPYTAFIDAFTSLCDEILELKGDTFTDLRDAIREAVGAEGAVLTAFLPKLEAVIGDEQYISDAPAELGLAGAQNRFNFLVRQFCRVICMRLPVALVIDDLQWADTASLKLLEVLVTDYENPGLLFVGCYRDNEVNDTHPLATMLHKIEDDTTISRLPVGNLDVNTITELLADVLSCDQSKAKPLAEITHKRTIGNIFFVKQFLKSLYDEGMLSFSLGTLKWSWEEEEIQTRTDMMDNVVDLMKIKIQKLPLEVQTMLQVAACLGANFDALTLESVLGVVSAKAASSATADRDESREEKANGEVVVQLDMCVDEGLLEQEASSPRYRFLHDQIQHAAYSLIPENMRAILQFQIGDAIVDSRSPSELEDVLFVAVDLLNCGAEHVLPGSTKSIDMARLNLRAGKKAIETAAYSPAVTYLEQGISLLGESPWTEYRELTLDLFSTMAEAEYCTGNLASAKLYIDLVLEQDNMSILDKFRAYSTLIFAYDVEDKMLEAINTSLFVVGQLGVTFPRTARALATIQSFLKTKRLLRGRSVESLANLPVMKDETKLLVMAILDRIILSCYRVMPDLLPLVVFKMVRWSVRFGVSKFSPYAFGFYGIVICGGLFDLRGGNEMGEVALALTDRLNAKATKSRTLLIVHLMLKPWTSPVQLSLKPFLHSYEVGLQTGDNQYAMLSVLLYCFIEMLAGRPLTSVKADIRTYGQQMKEYNQYISYHRLLPLWQFVINLTGRSENPCILKGEATELRKLSEHIEFSDNEEDCYRSMQIWLSCIFGDFVLAEKSFVDANFYKTLMGSVEYWRSNCLGCLAHFALARTTKSRRQKSLAVKRMKTVSKWVAKGQVNCRHMVHLFHAELAALEGKTSKAQEEYNAAISTAARFGFLADKALATERAGEFFLEVGDNDWAAHYLQLAHQAYSDWGAQVKTDHLVEKYPNFLEGLPAALDST